MDLYNVSAENLASVAILDTEMTDNDLPKIPSLNRLQTQPMDTDRNGNQAEQKFSNALRRYKLQKEAFKQAEEALFSLFRSRSNKNSSIRKRSGIKSIEQINLGLFTERGIHDPSPMIRSIVEPVDEQGLYLRTHVSATDPKYRTSTISRETRNEGVIIPSQLTSDVNNMSFRSRANQGL